MRTLCLLTFPHKWNVHSSLKIILWKKPSSSISACSSVQKVVLRWWLSDCNFCSSVRRYVFSLNLFRKIRHTVGFVMPSSLLPLTVDFLGLRTNACLTCSTCFSVTDDLPVLFLLHTHPVSWNCAYLLRMELLDIGCFPNLVRNCRWTVVTHRHSRNVSTQNAFSLPFAAILVNCAPSGEMHNYFTPHIIKENFENFLIHRCNYILLSRVYFLWQVDKTPTIIFNNPVLSSGDVRICSFNRSVLAYLKYEIWYSNILTDITFPSWRNSP